MTENTDPTLVERLEAEVYDTLMDDWAEEDADAFDCARRIVADLMPIVRQAKAEALNEAATALLTVSPHNPNTGMDSVVAAWLQGRAARIRPRRTHDREQ